MTSIMCVGRGEDPHLIALLNEPSWQVVTEGEDVPEGGDISRVQELPENRDGAKYLHRGSWAS